MRIVFLGTAEFGIPALAALRDAGHDIVALVTTPPRPAGRGLHIIDSPLARYAAEQGLGPVLCPENLKDPALAEQLKTFGADLFVVVAFRILSPSIFEIPPLGTVNIHASLLPSYRGPAPIHRAVEAGESETGVTVFRIDRGIDTGSIVVQKTTAIGSAETTPELYERLSALGSSALLEAITLMASPDCVYHTQDESKACGAPKLRKEESRILWTLPAATIYNRLRAFKPFPGCSCELAGQRLGIEQAELLAAPEVPAVPGTIIAAHKDSFDVHCGSGALRIIAVKPEGKKHMGAGEFLRGRRLTEGTVLQ